jgi:hypothetical protein
MSPDFEISFGLYSFELSSTTGLLSKRCDLHVDEVIMLFLVAKPTNRIRNRFGVFPAWCICYPRCVGSRGDGGSIRDCCGGRSVPVNFFSINNCEVHALTVFQNELPNGRALPSRLPGCRHCSGTRPNVTCTSLAGLPHSRLDTIPPAPSTV